MITAGKIIEMNDEELEQISGGAGDLQEKAENLRSVPSSREYIRSLVFSGIGGTAGAVAGIAAGVKWINEAKKSGNNIGFFGKAWRIVMTTAGGLLLGSSAGTVAYIGDYNIRKVCK